MAVTFANPIHPGEFLREEYLVPLALSPGKLARALGVPRTRIERIVREEIGISPDTAFRLARFFSTTPVFWLNLQLAYDLESEAPRLAGEIEKIVPYAA
ncbi:HigA family addiction module antitoxin [Aquabacter sediminis]|uniref:HigA family addiction module antitoxin n=1 Tax=Aquabacter sediminis TaxID=3029197 RepID=UPI00237DBDDC|nr:HigA family addiction module antitoxin [Aquabacter sp. P-9]MDE1567709.1 HigA family addiction module antitoxin [Aquabacter sp. P-9]